MRDQIQRFILRALLRLNRIVTDEELRSLVRDGYPRVAFSESDLGTHIRGVEQNELITGTTDKVFGKVWTLTVEGRIAAQQLG